MWIIKTRYERYTKDGKIWTEWFKSGFHTYDTETSARSAMELQKEQIKQIDKITKLKHEFSLEEI